MIMSSPHEVERFLLKYTKGASSILDISTGLGKNAYMIRVFNEPKFMIGLDVFLPYLKLVKYHKIYDDVILCDASKLPLKSDTFDVVIASEIIEHLDKRKGLSLLEEIDQVAYGKIVVITPNRPPFREGAMTSQGFNLYEAHLSSWSVSDFKSRGFSVFGLGLYLSRGLWRLGALCQPNFLLRHYSDA
jgi:SAM-dependent methyltransferase